MVSPTPMSVVGVTVGNVVPRVETGTRLQTTIPNRRRASCAASRRACAGGGAAAVKRFTNGSRVGSNSAAGFLWYLRVLCLMVAPLGLGRGSQASERRQKRGGLCHRVDLFPDCDLGGGRLLPGGWKQAYLGEFCSFPSWHPRMPLVWSSPLLRTLLCRVIF